ncbi:MAG TPA: hypothetical protein PLP18_02075 [Smithellaceae bacterium]|nr:hypothetical protein [Smithellaceae bacterium]
MKKIAFVFMLLAFVACASGNRYLPPEAEQSIGSVADTSKCIFIKNAYLESRASVMTHYIQLNVYNAGGDSYKITSTSQENIGGMVNATLVNFEIWKCKKEPGVDAKIKEMSPEPAGYAQKLRELKKLKEEGLLTDKEYEQKRKVIVDGM